MVFASRSPSSIQRRTLSRSQNNRSRSRPSGAGGAITRTSILRGWAGVPAILRRLFTKPRTIRDGISGRAFSATMRRAPMAAAAQTGSGLISPPSQCQRPAMRTGGKPKGTLQEASRCLQSTSGVRNRHGLSRGNSTVTAPNGTRGE